MTRITSRAVSHQVWIPGGEFLMGSDRHYADEGPTRRVTVEGFWIDTTPVTMKCDVVLSEDLGDGQDYDGVLVINPFAT